MNEKSDRSADLPAGTKPEKEWFEPVSAILMAVATLTTAWCSYESTQWNGQGNDLGTQADKLQREIFAKHLESLQIQSVQFDAFMQTVNAQLKGDEKTAKFYTDRFAGTLKPAYEKWLALKPFDNPAAPPHPFTPELYVPPFQQEILEARTKAAQLAAQSKATDAIAQGYLGNTVILAMILFFAGTASKFDEPRVRLSTLGFGIILFFYAVVRIVMLHFASI